MTVTLDDEANAKRPLKEAMRTTGAKRIREACMAFVARLKESIGQGQASSMAAKKAPPAERANSTYVSSAPASTKTSQLSIKYSFNPPPHVLYESLLDTDRIRGATASDANMSREVGGKFMMFSGSVEGSNVALEPFDGSKATIRWKWRFSTWAAGHFSDVTIVLAEKDGGTSLTLTQEGVPEDEIERTKNGWKGLLLERLKAMLGGSIMS
jgi:activator of HSP90 ATPase